MRTVHTYTVVPSLPEPLERLRELAYNLHFAWDHDTIALFRRLDRELWETSEHNPARMLGTISQERLQQASLDRGFLTQLDMVHADFRRYMDDKGWFSRQYPDRLGTEEQPFRIAYFSAEFGITECLPIYSGGLGILAGDHMKSASDLGLPLVGVGFLYQRGYFRQSLNADGWQVENYPNTDFHSLPIEPHFGPDGKPFVIAVNFPGRQVHVQVWKAQVGRIALYLLDTNLPQNSDADRYIAGNLYGGDVETRIQQEIVLGIGGMHALWGMGIRPTVCHMNEGHSAFLALERVRRLIQENGLSYAEAAEVASSGNLFTTHTPVPAGFDLFPEPLMRKYFESYARDVNLTFDQLLNLGRVAAGDVNENFNMATLALHHAAYVNGVSKLHGAVTRQMVQPVWPDYPEKEVPVGSVTNGVHTRSFLSSEMAELLDRYLGEHWAENPADAAIWENVDNIPDEELWRVHERRRERLVAYSRRYHSMRLQNRGASEQEVARAAEILNPNILTIGFARRFATYKRGNLLLRDLERMKRIITSADRPVQFLFAGKAHPRDDQGKDLIRQIVHFSRAEDMRRRVVFLEDYDMAMARYLVQGVDIWLNNPRRPMEASGTSGMKIIANGGLNFSVLDGWWAEGYDASVGWAIGRGEDYDDYGYQDHVEANAIYDLLEREITSLFYTRDETGLPRGWIAKMKASMKKLAPVFTTARMVREYADNYYVPAGLRYRELTADGFARAKSLVAWKQKVRASWKDVRIEGVQNSQGETPVGQAIPVSASVRLGGSLTPDDVAVQLYVGPVNADRQLIDGNVVPMTVADGKDGVYTYTGELPSDRSGHIGFAVRVVPSHPDAVLPQELELIAWE